MKIGFWLVLLIIFTACSEVEKSHGYRSVQIETLYQDSLSIRAIAILGNSLAFSADQGIFGSIDLTSHKVRTNIQKHDSLIPDFRAVAFTSNDFFMLSAANPALLYKTGDTGRMELVYKEAGEGVFYNSLMFWNDKEGIAMGDSIDGCLSILISRDGGHHWEKIPCSKLPEAKKGEGAFAASNTNIATRAGLIWIGTTAGRVYYSENGGRSWEVFQTPIVHQGSTQGIYSIDFYNQKTGVVFGGDYRDPEKNVANKAITEDGGKSWKLVASGKDPGYKSCVQFIPNSGGNDLVAVGFTGVYYSADRGISWKEVADFSFYTLRFQNDSVAYAAGNRGIAKLTFQ